MGAVHGVYLKYVGLSAASYGAMYLLDAADNNNSNERTFYDPQRLGYSMLAYSAIVNGAISIMFKLKRGMSLIGKNPVDGSIPLWSYVVYWPFHLPTMLYTQIHSSSDLNRHADKVPVASEVLPGWWIGGRYGNLIPKQSPWAGTIDLTVEFPELCIGNTHKYLLMPSWDGVPLPPHQLEEAAAFGVEARKNGDVMVHCAHGRGRSTTVLCACLVKAGEAETWQDSFNLIKKGRPVVKLNRAMRDALSQWQEIYVGNNHRKKA